MEAQLWTSYPLWRNHLTTGFFKTEYELIEPVLPQAAQTGIHFSIDFTTHS